MGTSELTQPPPAPVGQSVELMSAAASMHMVLAPMLDAYDPQRGRHVIDKGRKVVFRQGRASVPIEWMPEVTAHREFGHTVFEAIDPRAPLAHHGPQVVGGQGTVAQGRRGPQVQAPSADWDAVGARAIRERLARGQVADLQNALLYEFSHRNRGQVIASLSAAQRGEPDSENDEAPGFAPSESPGPIQPLPPGV